MLLHLARKSTAAVAQAALEKDCQPQIQSCAVEIQQALERHNCQLSGVFVWENSCGNVQVRIAARQLFPLARQNHPRAGWGQARLGGQEAPGEAPGVIVARSGSSVGLALAHVATRA